MRKRKFFILVFIISIVFPIGVVSNAIAANPNDDSRCNGLTGAAFGLCKLQ